MNNYKEKFVETWVSWWASGVIQPDRTGSREPFPKYRKPTGKFIHRVVKINSRTPTVF